MRNQLSDILAIIHCPETQWIAEVFDRHSTIARKARTHPFGLAVMLQLRWAAQSGQQASGLLLELGDDWFIDQASRAGVAGVRCTPTVDQLDHAFRRGGLALIGELAAELPRSAARLAAPVGMFLTDGDDLLEPRRERVVQVDGTVIRPYSDVHYDSRDGVPRLVGSRATDPARARVSPRFRGKKGGTAVGTPAIAVSAHGGLPWQRLVLDVAVYEDRAEVRAAMAAFGRLHRSLGARVQAFNYDKLLDGGVLRDVASQYGYIGVVEMQQPQKKAEGIWIPVEHQRWRGEQYKTRARCELLDTVTHQVDGRGCPHQLHGLDGSLRVTRPGESPTFDSPLAELTGLRRQRHGARWTMPATYRIPCRGGSFEWMTDFTRPMSNDRDLLHRLRPFPETHPHYDVMAGWRNNVEATFATLKRRLPFRRATATDPVLLQAHLVGAALAINAITWDVHVGRVTAVARHEYARMERATTAATAA